MRTRVEPVTHAEDRTEHEHYRSDDDHTAAFIKRAPRYFGVGLIRNFFFVSPLNLRPGSHHRNVSARPSAAARFKRAALCCAKAVTCETRAFASDVCAVITSRLSATPARKRSRAISSSRWANVTLSSAARTCTAAVRNVVNAKRTSSSTCPRMFASDNSVCLWRLAAAVTLPCVKPPLKIGTLSCTATRRVGKSKLPGVMPLEP